MTKEKIQEFTFRISQANESQLVVILYELFFYYIDDAVEVLKMGNISGYQRELDKAQNCLNELIASLNMEQEYAKAVFNVYLFVSGQMGLARSKKTEESLKDAKRVMTSLYETYKKDSARNVSAPVMQNAQNVYAGLTYGKRTLMENSQESSNRGFFA